MPATPVVANLLYLSFVHGSSRLKLLSQPWKYVSKKQGQAATGQCAVCLLICLLRQITYTNFPAVVSTGAERPKREGKWNRRVYICGPEALASHLGNAEAVFR